MSLIQKWGAALAGKKYINDLAVTQASQQAANAYVQNVFQWLFNNQPITLTDNQLEYTKAYGTNSDVYTCVDKIAKKLVATPIVVYEIKPDKVAKFKQYESLRYSNEPEAQYKAAILKAQSMVEVNQKDIENIILTPNPLQTQSEFFNELAGFYLLTGNGYTYLNGPLPGKQPWSEMFCLPSQFTEIISGGLFEPVKGYRLNYSYLANNNIIPFDAQSVCHMRTFNPDFGIGGQQLYGMSPLRALLLSMAMSKEGRSELLKQAKNGGTLGMFSPDGTGLFLGQTQQDDLKQKLSEIRNSNKSGERFFPSAGPLKYTQIGLPSTELALIEALSLSGDDIYRAYHTPLTFRSLAASTRDNMTQARRDFVFDAVMPLGASIEDKLLNRTICAPVNRKTGKMYVAQFDYQSLPEMQADMTKLTEWMDKSWEITPNERRAAKGYGESKEPAMNEIYIPSGYRNIKDAAITDDAFTAAQEP